MRRQRESVLARLLKKTFVLLLVFGIPAAVFILTFQLKTVKVQGSERYTSNELTKELVRSKIDTNTLLLYLKYKFFSDVKIPFIEKFDVEFINIHTVNIVVYEKRITGCIKFMGEYLYFDKDGIVVESSSKRLKKIPEIKGLIFNKIILNEKLEVQKKELFGVILNLTKQIEKYDLDVNTISFNLNDEVTIDCGSNKVLLGKRSTYDEVFSELKNILAKAKGMSLTIDMRDFEEDTKRIIAKPKKTLD